ncbi:MAG: cytochrome B [Hyphomicrobium sp.]|nr:cytochrome B [Hyphomicrobium sp.]
MRRQHKDPTNSNDQSDGRALRDVPVWDRAVRLFHWLVVACVTVAMTTGLFQSKAWFDIHVIAGSALTALIVFRLIWGFAGSTYARFSSFAYAPATILRELRNLGGNAAQHNTYVGHNPPGAAMIFALLFVLALLAVTGVSVLGGVTKEGPLAPFASFAFGQSAQLVHRVLAYGLLALVAFHISGVVLESVRTRGGLIRAMVTGSKPVPDHAIRAPATLARPALAGALTFLIIGPSALAIAHFAGLPPRGVPTATLTADYVKECGSCHSAHHPSVASRATWSAVMAGLDDHFGDNAALDQPVADEIRSYLMANASEAWDTAAANVLRAANPQAPLRITETSAWKSIHADIAASTFKRTGVGSKANCSNCHQDAAHGRFAPRGISIPQEKTKQ